MPRYKAGLHKEITSIFGGEPIVKDNGAQKSSYAPTTESPDSAPPKPPAPAPQTPPVSKPQQPEQPLPKAAPAKQPKANTTIKTARQIQWQQSWEQIKNKLFAPKPGVSATRQKAVVILIPVLFIALIFVLSQVFGTPARRTTKPSSKFEPTGALASFSNKIDWQIPDPYPTTFRDPMQIGSATATHVETSGLIVKGIVYSEDNPAAVIGTQIVCEGEKILGATIVKINENSVEFEMNGKKWTQKVQR